MKIKKMFVILFVLIMLFAFASPVMAGGGQIQGEKGQGSTAEIGCTQQPCYSENSEQPGKP